jgi:hypothetical protein
MLIVTQKNDECIMDYCEPASATCNNRITCVQVKQQIYQLVHFTSCPKVPSPVSSCMDMSQKLVHSQQRKRNSGVMITPAYNHLVAATKLMCINGQILFLVFKGVEIPRIGDLYKYCTEELYIYIHTRVFI